MDKAKELKAKIMAFQEKRKELFIATDSIFYHAVKKPLLIINEEELDQYVQQVSKEEIYHYEMWKTLENTKELLDQSFDEAPSISDYILESIKLWQFFTRKNKIYPNQENKE